MKKIVITICMVIASTNLMAGQKYNPYEQRWETVPDNWEMKYNPHESDWSYQPKNAQTTYNPYEDTWEWDSGHNR